MSLISLNYVVYELRVVRNMEFLYVNQFKENSIEWVGIPLKLQCFLCHFWYSNLSLVMPLNHHIFLLILCNVWYT